MTRSFPLIGVALVLCLISCVPDAPVPGEGPDATAWSVPRNGGGLTRLQSSPEYGALSRELQKQGGLRVARMVSGDLSDRLADGLVGSYHLIMAREFADFIKVPLVVEDFSPDSAFRFGGNSGPVYDDLLSRGEIAPAKADVFATARLVVHPLDPLPWLERHVRLIPVLPTRLCWLGPRSREPRSIRDLAGRPIEAPMGTSAIALLRHLDSSFRLGVLPQQASPENTERITDLLVAYRQSRDPASATGMFALSGYSMASWAVARDDSTLGDFLGQWLRAWRESGRMDQAFAAHFGINLVQYYQAVEYREPGVWKIPPEFQDYVAGLRRDGGLKMAVHRTFTIYEEVPGLPPIGMHHELLQYLANDLDLPVSRRFVTFPDFFSLNGAIPPNVGKDPDLVYTPDLIKEVDLYVSTLSALPWRKKLLDFVPLFPTRVAYVVPKDSGFIDESWLQGKIVGVVPSSSWESWMQELAKRQGWQLDVRGLPDTVSFVTALQTGDINAFVNDAHAIFGILRNQPELSIAPSSSPISEVNWAVAKDDKILAALLAAWLESMKEAGQFERCWNDFYGVTFGDYLELVATSGNE